MTIVKWFRYEVKLDMKWMVWSDLGMKWFRYEVTLVWSDWYEVAGMKWLWYEVHWYEVTDDMKWHLVWNGPKYEVVMVWSDYRMKWTYFFPLVWSDTKNEVNMIWSVWVPLNEGHTLKQQWKQFLDKNVKKRGKNTFIELVRCKLSSPPAVPALGDEK